MSSPASEERVSLTTSAVYWKILDFCVKVKHVNTTLNFVEVKSETKHLAKSSWQTLTQTRTLEQNQQF